jgi:ribosome-binding protein aMBF1 (putative translation factor)
LVIEFLGYDPEPVPEDLAGQIRYARRRLGMTEEQLAEAIGVRGFIFWHWEAGRLHPDRATLQKIQELIRGRAITDLTLQ